MLGFPMPRVPLVWGPVTSYRALDRQPLTLAHNLVKREAAECETGRKGTALAKSARGGGTLSLLLCSLTFHVADTQESHRPKILRAPKQAGHFPHPPYSAQPTARLRASACSSVPLHFNHTCTVSSAWFCVSQDVRGLQCTSLGTCSTTQPPVPRQCPCECGHHI